MVFFLGALVIAGFSWRSFSTIRSYRFFRFLAVVALWAVTAINLPWWSLDFSSAMQIISWVLILGFLALAIWGFLLLQTSGSSTTKNPPPGFARTSHLVTTGPFRHIRHPLYASFILFGWGEALMSGKFFGIFFALLVTALFYLTALLEEEENLDRFGAEYAEYMTTTRMFVPGLF
jgi:protein-S-isoprenylcysteine O-methyltransferase Ste14